MNKDEIQNDFKRKMQKSTESLTHEFSGLRTGRASVALLDNVKVDYYGTLTPLSQMASLSVPESRTIIIQPWDTSQMHAIEKSILASDLGLNPTNDGKVVRINIPQPTAERRKELVKVARKYAEECKVSIRNLRRDANEALKKLEKDKTLSQDELKKATQDVQDLTDRQIKKIDELVDQKEAEILEV